MTPRRAANPYRVLLVEDSRAMVRLLREVLGGSHRPFEVTDVGTLADAIDQLDDDEPDVIVLDLSLPDADGTSGLVAIRQTAPNVPVVVLTGNSANDEIAMKVLRAGAQDYLSKVDDDWEQLGRTISYAIERHGVHRELHSTTEQLRTANERLKELVQLDPLTGMLNRRGMAGALPNVLATAARKGQLVFALMADLDDFGKINERLGYSVGDIIMREIANRIRKRLGPADRCGRLGGDELLVLLTVGHESEAWHAAERIRLAMSPDILVLRDGAVRVTASFSLVPLDEQHTLLDRVMATAGEALQISKQLGKDRISGRAPSPFDEPVERTFAIAQLTKSSSFHRVQQRIVRLEDEHVIAHEYLNRFAHSPYQHPAAFLPLAAEVNLLTTVDHLCLQASLEDARAAKIDTAVHIDLLPATLLSLSAEHLDTLLDGLAPQQICVEISAQHIGDAANVVSSIEHLRQAGARLALDDVGFGRSSLESLVRLEPAVIKLDERCTRDAVTERGRHDLERLLAILRTTDAQVIAQEVETPTEREALAELGITHAQGPLWDPPG